MDTMDYEAKRKEQNREAQRRYRERMKTSSSRKGHDKGHPASVTAFSPAQQTAVTHGYDAISQFQPDTSGSLDTPDFASHTGTSYFDHENGGDYFDGSVDAFGFNAGGSDTPSDIFPNSLAHSSGRHMSISSLTQSAFAAPRSGSTAPSSVMGSSNDRPTVSRGRGGYSRGAASKLCAKAENLVDELERLYEFGVDIDLMEVNDTLLANLSTTRFLFRKSVNPD